MQYPALVLNADFQPLSYFPLSTISWQDAMKAVYEKTHFVVETYEKIVHSPSIEMKLPSVLALTKYQPQPKRVAFTRFNVFLRDHFSCQYCGERHVGEDLTFEHVVPRSRDGKTSWTNIATACHRCNTLKDSKTPAEAGMHLRRIPREPDVHELIAAKRKFPPGYLHDTWQSYLYWNVELEELALA